MKALPDFWGSPWFVPEVDNWHLKDGAPEELKREFEEYMRNSDIIFSDDEEDDE